MQPPPLLEPVFGVLSNLETATATGSQETRRSSQQPCPLMEVPATPRLGLRPPRSASSSNPETAGPRRVFFEQVQQSFNERNNALHSTAESNEARPGKPKIAAWGGRHTRHLLAIDPLSEAKEKSPTVSAFSSRACSVIGEVEEECRKPLRPRISRPRPACRLNPNLVHTELLRQNEFTTTTTQYRTYGSQWVLTQQRTKGGLLAGEVEKNRAEIAQREGMLQHIEVLDSANADCS